MNIVSTQFDLNNNALEIYLSGCKAPHCPGCHNPELWNFNIGTPWVGKIKEIELKGTADLVKRYWIMGGEPLHQDPYELREMIACLFINTDCEIWVWTREKEVDKDIDHMIHWWKLGEYKEDLPSYTEDKFGITLASTNQVIVEGGFVKAQKEGLI